MKEENAKRTAGTSSRLTKKELLGRMEYLSEANELLKTVLRERDASFESLKHLGAILEESILEIYVFEKKSLRFIHANKKARENLGYSMAEMSGLTLYNIKREDDSERFESLIEPLLTGSADRVELPAVFFRRDGSSYPVEMHLQSSTFNNEPVYVAVVLDVSKQTSAEDNLGKALDQLSKINRYESVVSIVSRSVHGSVNLMTVMENSVQAIHTNMEAAENVSIYLVEGSVAEMHAHRGYPDWFIKRVRRLEFPRGAVWRTIIEGKTKYVQDADDDPHLGPAGFELGIKSYVIIPLKGDGKVLGVLSISTSMKNALRADELRVLDIVSKQIEIAIGNAKFTESLIESEKALQDKIEKLSRKESYDKIINTISASVHSSVDFEEVLRLAVMNIRETVRNADFLCIHFAEGNTAVLKASYGHEEEYLRKVRRIPYPKGVTWNTIMGGRTVFSEDADNDTVLGPAAHELGIKSYVSLPIKSVGNTAGCMTLTSLSKKAFLVDEISLLESIAEQIGHALLNARYVQEIETNEKRLKALVGSVDEIVCEVDEAGTYLGIWTDNEALLVRPKDEMLGRKVSELYSESLGKAMTEAIKRVIKYKRSESAEYTVDLGGKERIFRAVINPIAVTGDSPGTASILYRDVTESKALETLLLRSQRLDSIGKLAGGIAHDLNNILQPIMMSIQLLSSRVQDEQTRSWLDILDSSARRGSDLIKQILSFARGLESKKQPFNIRYLVKDIEKLVKETFPKFITLNVNIARDIPTVLGDYTQLNQVFMNLCVNARDAMPSGGAIDITIKRLAADGNDTPGFLNTDENEYVVIKVSDTGVGIPPENLDRIFDPFFTTKSHDKGTGLGLSTVYGIVKDHDGFINVDSAGGKGTTFSIYLPVIKSTGITDSLRDLYSSIPAGNGELILVVDDENMITDMARSILEEYDYKVLIANNGEEATAIFHTHKNEINAVVVDMMMPVMGGKATIRVLKKESPAIKVIAMSGYQREHELIDIQDVEVDAFLPKPFNAETLLQTLSQLIH